ncbi:MAG: glycosyltransferase family 39 protein [Planctomycetes bacterium]|nr:glycosyltransferase family 39 protein [Planctomycetota bacterium]MCB9903348.1 glycosyltransferase family 39 protein [Planctomycetota bacterium]
MTSTDHARGRPTTGLLAAGCALFAMTLAWLATRGPVLVDSGIFASCGWHVLQGKALYLEAWDSKPPGITLLDGLALAVGGREIESVRTMELLFGAAAALCVFRIALVALRSRAVATASALLFAAQFYSGKVFQGGNLTEEYASVFALAGVLGAVEAGARAGRARLVAVAGAGFSFGLAALTKEPFALSALPWLAFVLLAPRAEGEPRAALRVAGIWIVAGLVPLAAVLTWLASRGAAAAWWDSITYHFVATAWDPDAPRLDANRAASASLLERVVTNWRPAWDHVLRRVPITSLAALLGLYALGSREFLCRTRWFPVPVLAMLAADYLGTLVSPRQYGHYYMQLVGSFVLLAACGLGFVAWKLEGLRAKLPAASKRLGLVVAVVALAAVAFGVVREDLVGRFRAKFAAAREFRSSAIATAILAEARPGDTLWATSGNNSRYYLETGLLSPTRYLFVFDHVFVDSWLDTGAEKLARVRADLAEAPPRFVIVAEGDAGFLEHTEFFDWITRDYVRTDVVDDDPNTRGHVARLFVRREGRQ